MTSKRVRTLQYELHQRLDSDPDGDALTFVDSRGRLVWQSFASLYADAARCGSILADRGLGRGDACVLVLPSEDYACHAVMGCFLVGAIPVLVAPPVVRGLHSNLSQVVRYVARKTSAQILVVGEDAIEIGESMQAAKSAPHVVFAPDDWRDGDANFDPRVSRKASDIGAFQLTSGTTGFPKVCVWEQRGILAALDGMQGAMNLSSSDVFVNWTPLYHDMGLVNNFFLCLVKNIPLAMIETMEFLKRPGLWLRALHLTNATHTWAPNFGYALASQRITDSELDGIRLDRVKGFWNAAERIHIETMLEFHKRFENFGVSLESLKTNFGCAENVGGATFSDPDGRFVYEQVDALRLYKEGIAYPIAESSEDRELVDVVSAGRPFPGMHIDIMSRNGRKLKEGYVGEVAIRTPSRMKQYLGNVRDTSRAIRGQYLHTGDLAYMRGDELFWVGRVQERINLHGKKYDPSDFEQALLKIDGLRKGCFAAFGVDDSNTGTQRLIIVAETRDGASRPKDEIADGVVEQVATEVGAAVDEVVLLPQGTMSKTSSGKRRHRFYREQYMAGLLTS